MKDPGAAGRALCNLAEAMQLRGDGDQDALLDEAIVLHRQTGDKQSEVQTLTLMANSALQSGDACRASHLYIESLSLCQTIGDRTMIANIALFERIAALALATEQPGEAARLLGCGDALRDELGAPLIPYLRPLRDHCMDQLRFTMQRAKVTAAIAEGHALPPGAAIREALTVCERAQSDPNDRAAITAGAVPDTLDHASFRRTGEGSL